MRKWLYLGVWSTILVAALFLQVLPFFFVFMIFSLAIGFPKGVAMLIFPIAAIAMICIGGVIASKFAKRLTARPAPDERIPNALAKSSWALAGKPLSPSQYYRDFKRLGLYR